MNPFDPENWEDYPLAKYRHHKRLRLSANGDLSEKCITYEIYSCLSGGLYVLKKDGVVIHIDMSAARLIHLLQIGALK